MTEGTPETTSGSLLPSQPTSPSGLNPMEAPFKELMADAKITNSLNETAFEIDGKQEESWQQGESWLDDFSLLANMPVAWDDHDDLHLVANMPVSGVLGLPQSVWPKRQCDLGEIDL